MSDNELFDQLGGEAGIRRLVDRFYDHMDSRPEAKPIRDLHPKDLAGSREKLFLFLVGWSGGPPRYIERFGHPRLRMRHFPFPIGKLERDLWLQCMLHALEDMGIEEPMRFFLMDSFLKIADHMRNKDEKD